MTQPIIELFNISKRYGTFKALHETYLNFEPGRVYGILGPNGAGKTTLVEIIEGLRMPSSGKVRVAGLDPFVEKGKINAILGVQLQDTHLPEDLSVEELLKLFASFYSQSLPIQDLLVLSALESSRKKRLRFLSGGQRQRLAIALALISDPDILIFDEPTTGLDPMARRACRDLILRLKGMGKTILLTTHYIEEAEQCCDWVMIFNQGRLETQGTPGDLIRSAGHSVCHLTFETDQHLDLSAFQPFDVEIMSFKDNQLSFRVSDPVGTLMRVLQLIELKGYTLIDLQMKKPSLEDVYLEILNNTQTTHQPEEVCI